MEESIYNLIPNEHEKPTKNKKFVYGIVCIFIKTNFYYVIYFYINTFYHKIFEIT